MSHSISYIGSSRFPWVLMISYGFLHGKDSRSLREVAQLDRIHNTCQARDTRDTSDARDAKIKLHMKLVQLVATNHDVGKLLVAPWFPFQGEHEFP